MSFHDGVLPDRVSPCLAKEILAHLHFIYGPGQEFYSHRAQDSSSALMGRETGNLSLLNHLPLIWQLRILNLVLRRCSLTLIYVSLFSFIFSLPQSYNVWMICFLKTRFSENIKKPFVYYLKKCWTCTLGQDELEEESSGMNSHLQSLNSWSCHCSNGIKMTRFPVLGMVYF